MGDMDRGLSSAVDEALPTAWRLFCTIHRQWNMFDNFKKDDAAQIAEAYVTAACTRSSTWYTATMARLRAEHPDGHEYLTREPNTPEHWAQLQVPDEVETWGVRVSSLVESWHNVVGAEKHNLPLQQVIVAVVAKMRGLWRRHINEYDGPAQPILPVNRHKVHDALVEEAMAHSLDTKATRQSLTRFLVGTPGHDEYKYVVDFSAESPFSQAPLLCTCRLPLVEGRPCVHVVGAARASGTYDAVNFYHPKLTVATAQAMYAAVSSAATPDAASSARQQAAWADSDLKLPVWVKKKQVPKAEVTANASRAYKRRTTRRTGSIHVVRTNNRGHDEWMDRLVYRPPAARGCGAARGGAARGRGGGGGGAGAGAGAGAGGGAGRGGRPRQPGAPFLDARP